MDTLNAVRDVTIGVNSWIYAKSVDKIFCKTSRISQCRGLACILLRLLYSVPLQWQLAPFMVFKVKFSGSNLSNSLSMSCL